MDTLKKIFQVEKPVIGMLHLDYLEGKNFKGVGYVAKKAIKDIRSLQEGGINGILIENWKEDSREEFVSPESAEVLDQVMEKIVGKLTVPFGFNILNNDYKLAFNLAAKYHAAFVELDVFVDRVESDFKFSQAAKDNPFEINPDPAKIISFIQSVGAGDVPLFCFIQPKHYKMLDRNKSIEQSASEAGKAGAKAVLVTKETGTAPTLDLVKKAKGATSLPVGIGSGLSSENAEEYLSVADFAIVGTSIKEGNITDNPVDVQKTKSLMQKVAKLRSNLK